MQLFAPPAQAVPPSAQANSTNPDSGTAAPLDLSQYYADADTIPDYAQDEVAIATEAGLIVNYPDPKLFNPNQPISRGETAALIYQVLENRGELEPLPADSDSSQVRRLNQSHKSLKMINQGRETVSEFLGVSEYYAFYFADLLMDEDFLGSSGGMSLRLCG